jgi:hypothetical protein
MTSIRGLFEVVLIPRQAVDAFYLDDPDGNEIEIATWRG